MESLIEEKKASQGAIDRQMQRRFSHVARIMSGELNGFGSKVHSVNINYQNRACTDGKIVSIPADLDENPAKNLIMQEAVLAHEVAGHHRYTDFVAWDQKVVQLCKNGTCDPMLHDFTNIIEDARINHLLAQDFPGSGRRMDFTHDVFMGRHKASSKETDSLKQQAMVAIMSECIAHAPHWSTAPEVIDFMDEARPILTNAIRQPDTSAVIKQATRLIKLFRTAFPDDAEELDPKMGDFDMSGESESQQEVSNAAREQQNQGRNPERVSKNRFDEMPSLEETAEKKAEQDAQQSESKESEGETGEACEGEDGEDSDETGSDGSCEGEGEGEGGDGDSDDSQDGEANGEGTCEDGELGGNGQESDADSHEGDGETFEGGTDFNPNGDADKEQEFHENYANLIADAQNQMETCNDMALEDERNLTEELEVAIESVNTEKLSIRGHSIEVIAGASDMFHHDYDYHRASLDNGVMTYDNTKTANSQGIRILSEEIKRQLKGRNSRNQTGLKRGRVNNRDIWKVNQTGAKMFKQRTIPKKTHASAIILIDSSGSMGGDRAVCAAKAAVVFSEVMENCGVDFEVVDFSYSRGSSLRIRKPLGGRLGMTEKSVIASPTAGGCNADGYCVQWAIDRLMTRQGAKMLFVLSDGQPTDGGPNGMGAQQWLKQVVSSAPKEIAITGVGIQSDAVKQFYPNNAVIQNVNQLPDKMIPIMRPMLKKLVQ